MGWPNIFLVVRVCRPLLLPYCPEVQEHTSDLKHNASSSVHCEGSWISGNRSCNQRPTAKRRWTYPWCTRRVKIDRSFIPGHAPGEPLWRHSLWIELCG